MTSRVYWVTDYHGSSVHCGFCTSLQLCQLVISCGSHSSSGSCASHGWFSCFLCLFWFLWFILFLWLLWVRVHNGTCALAPLNWMSWLFWLHVCYKNSIIKKVFNKRFLFLTSAMAVYALNETNCKICQNVQVLEIWNFTPAYMKWWTYVRKILSETKFLGCIDIKIFLPMLLR